MIRQLMISIVILLNVINGYKINDLDGFQIFPVSQMISSNSEPVDITAELGMNIAIKIRANPTTGYSVYLKNSVADLEKSNIVTPLNLNNKGGSSDYIVDPHPIGMVGVPGYYYFKFKTKSVGEIKLNFVHMRIWDPTDAATLKVNLSVVQGKIK